MAKPKEIPVKNLSDYTEAIEENLATSRARHPDSLHVGNWYRGCGLGISHKLNPHLYRHPKIKKIEELLELERRMLEDFRRHSVLQDVRGTFEGLDWRFQTLFLFVSWEARLLEFLQHEKLGENPAAGKTFTLFTSTVTPHSQYLAGRSGVRGEPL